MDKYDLLKIFHHGHRLQVYMYDLMYVDPETIPVVDYFPATKTFFENYKKMSTPGSVPKHWIRFSYIFLEDYGLDVIFNETELKKIWPHIQR